MRISFALVPHHARARQGMGRRGFLERQLLGFLFEEQG